MSTTWAAAALSCVLLCPAAARAIDGFSISQAQSDKRNIDKTDLGFVWNGPVLWRANSGRYPLALVWEAHLARWTPHDGSGTRTLTEAVVSPILRLEFPGSWRPYAEASIGPGLLSHSYSSDDHHFATAFQFYDFIGLGIHLGPNGKFQASYRLVHESNCDWKQPNPGTNFNQLTLQYNF
ncbi:acyloxyacyl hydrolase [Paludibacterium yongneupense]|uniref:acyloxyacyl hydrolase n=1 Tax=Paludibacterium yongneupense TaxID=400061 RepID=UPI00040BD03D|nr:acyloxyacyl hydrolase [Paludibacterium yongneupense]